MDCIMKARKIVSEAKRALVFLLVSGCAWTAQAGIVKGTVKDGQNGEPLTGATVVAAEMSDGATESGATDRKSVV